MTRVLFLLAALSLGACSSIVEGTSQSVTIATDPSGATCKLLRGGMMIGAVNPTPATVMVDKSRQNIAIECEKEGYQRAAGTAASELEGMTFGNILVGGFIGLAVDAASGAMNKYPPMVTVALVPESFPTEADRITWLSRQTARIEKEAVEATSKVSRDCRPVDTSDSRCSQALKAIEDEKAARLASITSQIESATVP